VKTYSPLIATVAVQMHTRVQKKTQTRGEHWIARFCVPLRRKLRVYCQVRKTR
jgi:hypothetical protein